MSIPTQMTQMTQSESSSSDDHSDSHDTKALNDMLRRGFSNQITQMTQSASPVGEGIGSEVKPEGPVVTKKVRKPARKLYIPSSSDSETTQGNYREFQEQVAGIEKQINDLQSSKGYATTRSKHDEALTLAGEIGQLRRAYITNYNNDQRRLASLTDQGASSSFSIPPLILLILMLVLFMYRKPIQRYFAGKASPMRRNFIQKKVPVWH